VSSPMLVLPGRIFCIKDSLQCLTKFRSFRGAELDGVLLREPRSSAEDSYLVDSASSHMLVSKIKPCMSKYKQLYCETANGSLNQL
jgi:hypothetical protein